MSVTDLANDGTGDAGDGSSARSSCAKLRGLPGEDCPSALNDPLWAISIGSARGGPGEFAESGNACKFTADWDPRKMIGGGLWGSLALVIGTSGDRAVDGVCR